jgi:uncharacterized Rossmann fold enzyme
MLSTCETFVRKITTGPRYALDGLIYRWSNKSSKLRMLRNHCSGEPLLIVGSGPSLLHTPLEEMQSVTSIGMNKIDLLFSKTLWRPSIIVCQNTMVVRQHAESFAKSSIPVFIAHKTRWFLRRQSRSMINFFHIRGTPSFSRDLMRGVGYGHTVTYTALQFAWYMGANPVILVGIDHSFKSTGKPLEYERMKTHDVNHFAPDYFKQGQLWGVPDLNGSEEDYRAAQIAFRADGREVLDATVGGKLDVFPRISISDAIRICTRMPKQPEDY